MKRVTLLTLGLVVSLILVFSVSAVFADARINVVHHFGGDTLFCTNVDGCKLLNKNGETLWQVEQSVIDAAMADACETRQPQFIEAGEGTYGPNVLELACYEGMGKSLNLTGFDEWGKPNSMKFSTDYAPVSPPVAPNQPVVVVFGCSVDLAAYGFMSIDGIHNSVGFDIWDADFSNFLYWSPTSLGQPACDFKS